ncbi:MBL fold metallo-hydrolase [Shinella zoogloeoides]|uniref:MBL fold metallo-hydrolase n=1 Tax=Shinella zoogloeoides TaxID=352475 RepID=A0A6N8TFI5_SHIZO|nr:MBL fold metallo-hydrolase [Shinella zoogloeoides]MXN99947.1 MBL fold metallo-hydrolase [Shinella zoogloeoides]UEX82291.1 MBL fold metallo-hydrolase [Shinella zoogloeoides]
MGDRSTISRRSLFLAAGAATMAAPLVLNRAAALAQTESDATDMRVRPLETRSLKLGSFRILTVRDGMRASGAPNETFGTDQSADAVGALLKENFLPGDTFVNSFTPALVDTGAEVVLFDTGMGEGGRDAGMGRLVEGLKYAGYTPDQISVVVITHMHGDHIGGLMEGGKPAFPNARYVTGRTEYDFWVNPARMGTPAEQGHQGVLAKVQPLAEKLTFIEDGGEVVPGITGLNAFGHSPGHMIFRIESEGRAMMLTADTANHFVLSLQRPDWEVRFDMDKAQAAATRRKVFDMIATDRLAFIGYHMPFPAAGFVEKAGEGYRFVPVSYQFDL